MSSCLAVLLTLLLVPAAAVDLPAASARQARRANRFQPYEAEATVLAVIKSDSGTYIHTRKESGYYLWIRLARGDEVEVREGQRVAFTVTTAPLPDGMVEWYQRVEDFRILAPEERTYRGASPDGALIFTDNPETLKRRPSP